jgi:hypothetical protein
MVVFSTWRGASVRNLLVAVTVWPAASTAVACTV